MNFRLLTSILIVLGGGVILLIGLGRRADTERSQDSAAVFTGNTMGTTYSVKVVGMPANVGPDRVAGEIQEKLDRVNDLMSTYKPDSELSRFNRHDSDAWFDVSAETTLVVDAAIRVGDLTGGTLDVTVGPIVDLWNFGPKSRPTGEVPTDAEIAAARVAVGYRQLQVRHDPPSLRKQSPDCRVDLSSLAKGFAVDQVAESLESLGMAQYMIEVGGEVRTRGQNATGQPWQIAVEVPNTVGRSIQRVVALNDRAMATSGDYRNYFEQDGVRFCHIIDPRSGRPVRHRLASVSVLADTCMEADALATALFVLGPERGLQLATKLNLSAIFLVRTDDGFTEHPTPAFTRAQP